MPDLTPEMRVALQHARHLASNGVPIFVAKQATDASGTWLPDGGHHGSGYWLPKKWQLTEADPDTIDSWRPGDALCAVMGHTVDLLDVDPRSGGDESLDRLRRAGAVPLAYAEAATPSGGSHFFIASMGVRSLDGLLPGIDIKAGDPDGRGRGFAFIAPTEKLSKGNGTIIRYVWDVAPQLDQLTIVGGDNSGEKLATLVSNRSPKKDYTGPVYDGPGYDELPPDEKRLADTYVQSVIQQWRDTLEEAASWPEGARDGRDRGWEELTKDAAWALARVALAPWTPLEMDDAQKEFETLLPDVMLSIAALRERWTASFLDRVQRDPIPAPWWQDFLPPANASTAASVNPDDYPDFPTNTADAYISPWLAVKGLNQNWCWSRELGWMSWDGRRWCVRSEESLREAVRLQVIDLVKEAIARNITGRALSPYTAMLSSARIGSIGQLMRGYVEVDPSKFDQQPDFLNVGNGIVDLRTGDLLPHDRKWHLTKLTETKYLPGTRHDDWDQCLQALDADVCEWMRLRIGQAVTGHITSDDTMPICQGGGSNGKSTLISALRSALGEYVTFIPEKLLRASPNDHPTELMTLFGARLAVIDETPEAAKLNVQRLKSVVGAEYITARQIHKNNVTWKATHSLFVLTNYVPTITETDEGTWRRLALVRFRKKFAPDDDFRARVTRGGAAFREAVLAWVVRGSVEWYASGKRVPAQPTSVKRDTDDWRMDSDLILRFITDHLEFDRDSSIASRDLLDVMNEWLVSNSNQPWSDRLVSSRLLGHEIVSRNNVSRYQHQKSTPPPNLSRPSDALGQLPDRPMIWRGLRWRTEESA